MALDPTDPGVVKIISKDRNVFRALQELSQSGGIRFIYDIIIRNKLIIQVYQDRIPGLLDLFLEQESFSKYISSHPNEWLGNSSSFSPEIKTRAKALRTKYNRVKKWSEIFTTTAASMRREGLIQAPTTNPNRAGRHFKAAKLFTSMISKYWFVKEVVLFGSVVIGKEKPGSDVDIVVKAFSNRAIVGHIISGVAKTVSIRLGIEVSPLLFTPGKSKKRKAFFKEAGFFEATETLFHRDGWSFKVGKKTYFYKAEDLIAHEVFNHWEAGLYSFLLLKNESVKQVVVVYKKKELAICNGIQKAPYNWFGLIPQVVATNREISKNEESYINDNLLKLGFEPSPSKCLVFSLSRRKKPHEKWFYKIKKINGSGEY